MLLCCPELCNTSSSLVQPNCGFRKTNIANEISSKWSLASLLQIDYNWGVVFPTSALISAAKTPLILFLEWDVAVRQLSISEGAWCVVFLLDVTLFMPVILFLICFVNVWKSCSSFFFVFTVFFSCVSHFSHPLFFLPFPSFYMWRRCHWCGSHQKDETIQCWSMQGRVFFFLTPSSSVIYFKILGNFWKVGQIFVSPLSSYWGCLESWGALMFFFFM